MSCGQHRQAHGFPAAMTSAKLPSDSGSLTAGSCCHKCNVAKANGLLVVWLCECEQSDGLILLPCVE
jgi:hypothetical protein